MLCGPREHQHLAVPIPPCSRLRNQLVAAQVSGGGSTTVLDELVHRSCTNNLAAFFAGVRAQLNDKVGRFDHVAVMLDNHDRIAGRREIAKDAG